MRSQVGNIPLNDYIQSLKNYKGFAGDIVCHRTIQPQKAVFASTAPELKNNLSLLLECLGVKKLYKHQKKAIEMINRGIHTVIATPTASGKSLIYNLPVIDKLIEDPQSHALYLFPLKALARDQLDTVQRLLSLAGTENHNTLQFKAAVYDGDISAYQKSKIRKAPPHILLTNPEMLHLAMLAHHHLWENFFRHLKYIVIDEVHTYRGVMGSNMAWVFRRLQRICRLYGSEPVFIFCSATIANPALVDTTARSSPVASFFSINRLSSGKKPARYALILSENEAAFWEAQIAINSVIFLDWV